MNYTNYFKASILFVILMLSGAAYSLGNCFNEKPETSADYFSFITECDEIEIKLEITHTSGNLKNGKIVMDFEKSTGSYTCFIFSGNSDDNRFDIKDNKASDLAKGEYNLYIQNKSGCTKHMKFKIN